MPLVTRIGDLDSVFVFGFVTARMPLVTRAGGSVSVNTLTIQEGVSGLVWQENTSCGVFEEAFMIKMDCISVSYPKTMID